MNKKLLWCDLEMTGLALPRDRIIEIAVVVTTHELEILPEPYQAAIRTSPLALSGMSPRVREMHEKSGLIQRVRASNVTMAQAEREAIHLVRSHFREAEAILAGNSIATDRRFLARWMPQLDAYLHYRMVDVTSIKELARRWYPKLPKLKKAETHTAMADVLESIEELRYYRTRIFKSKPLV